MRIKNLGQGDLLMRGSNLTIVDLRLQILAIKTQKPAVRKACTSIGNLQSAILNHKETGPKDQILDAA